jgi:hypothetical protein
VAFLKGLVFDCQVVIRLKESCLIGTCSPHFSIRHQLAKDYAPPLAGAAVQYHHMNISLLEFRHAFRAIALLQHEHVQNDHSDDNQEDESNVNNKPTHEGNAARHPFNERGNLQLSLYICPPTGCNMALWIVLALFVLAIISPWVFPNKMVSKNEHDIKH